jgi:hypothetical protein
MPGLESIQCSGRFRFNVPDGWVHVRLQLSDVRRLICLASRGKLLTHPHFPQLSRSRPRRRRAVHFSRLFSGECESSRLLFLGCRERPEGLFRGRSCFFCGLRVAGGWVRGPESGENTGKSGRETKNAESSHSRRFGVWYWGFFFRRKTKSSWHRARICNRLVNGALISFVQGCPLI